MLKRVHLYRIVGPFFLGAIFMYSIQIFYSYPSLERYTSSHLRAIERYGYRDGFVDRIPRRYGGKNNGKYNGKAHPAGKMAMKTLTRVAPGQGKYKMLLDEVEYLFDDDFEKRDSELVIDPKLDERVEIDKIEQNNISDIDEQKLDRRFDIDKKKRYRNQHVDDKNRDRSADIGDKIRNRSDGIVKKIGHPPGGKDKPIYNKDITIPRHKHYVDEPVDAHNYNYLHKPSVCSKLDGRRLKVLLIFIVTTAPQNFDRRMLIRKTYGNKRHWPVLSGGAFRTVFLLGTVDNKTLQNNIHNESETYKDIVQEDFIDCYANLTLKTVMGLKWVTNYCRQAKYTMKIDDDSMIHQNRLLHLLKNATAVNFTAAESLMDAPVIRNTSSKYYISEDYYPVPTYPPYLNGPGYLISTDLTEGLYNVAVRTPLFPWEDVFMGICLKQLGVTPILHHDFILIIAKESQIKNKTKAANLFRYFTVVSNLEPEYMTLMWTKYRARIKKDKRR